MTRPLRKMTDSTTAGDNPHFSELKAGYVNGLYANVDKLRALYPNDIIVTITVDSTADAHVIDCEPGDATPQSAARWTRGQVDRGKHPTIYTSVSMVPAVLHECSNLGLKWHRDFEIWQAHYDGVAELPRGFVAKQYTDHGPKGEHYDMSVVAPYWPGVDPAPQKTKPVQAKPKAKPFTPHPWLWRHWFKRIW